MHLLKEITKNDIDVFRNDKITLEKVESYDKIVLSPGPGVPKEAHILKPLIKRYASTKSLLGVCLGQQAIAEAFGGKLLNTKKVYHGITSNIDIIDKNEKIFKGLSKRIEVGRYHYWIVSQKYFPKELTITAKGP